MAKINQHGLNLRKKSAVHASIIDETTGRRKLDSSSMTRAKIFDGREWDCNGTHIPQESQFMMTIDANILVSKKSSNVLVLGPGEGAEAIFLKKIIKGNIDVLGAEKELSEEAEKIVRKDYSPNSNQPSEKNLFEHMNHLKLVGKYDYIFSELGPVLHTRHPEIVILKVASMLRPGGFARIINISGKSTIENCIEYLKKTKNSDKIEFVFDFGSLIIKRLK